MHAAPPRSGDSLTDPGGRQTGRRIWPLRIVGIVAIVLLLAMASVLTVFLYEISVDVQPHCPCDVPFTLGMLAGNSSNPSPGLYFEAVKINPTTGLTTNLFGLRVVTPDASMLKVGVAPATCAAPDSGALTAFTPKNCGASAGVWYAVLVFENTTIQSTYDSSGHWTGSAAPLERSTAEIYLVSDEKIAGSGDTISAFGTGPAAVSGVAVL